MSEEPKIEFSLKEILQEMRDEIRALAAGKASRDDVVAVNNRVDGVEDRLLAVEKEQEHRRLNQEDHARWKSWAVPAAVLVAVTVFQVLIQVYVK